MNSNEGKVNANLRYVRKPKYAHQTKILPKFIFWTLHQIWLGWQIKKMRCLDMQHIWRRQEMSIKL